MSESINKEAQSQEKEVPSALDAFKDFTFSTAWSVATRPEPRTEGYAPRRPAPGGNRPDRRPPAGNFNRGPDNRGADAARRGPGPQDRRPAGPGEARRPQSEGAGGRPVRPPYQAYRPFQPIVDVAFYPEETPFNALIQALRTSGRTYPLFDIAALILEKPERFVAVINAPKKEENAAAAPFFLSVPDGLPFEKEDAALAHVFQHHFQDFFDKTETEGEAPKGAFSFVYRCPCTGELITPPNYHKAQTLLQEHHASHHAAISFDQFQQRLEKASEPEAIQTWLQKMSRQTTYTVKGGAADAPSFDTFEGAQHHALTHAKERLVKAVKTARFSGKLIESLPQSTIRQSLEAVLVKERRFPMETVNHLRGRLRRLHFSLFKRSGIAYVSAIKRRLRIPGLEFSVSIQGLVSFLEGKEGLLAHQLPEQYLGITVPEQGVVLEAAADQALKTLMQDLHWLIREGYVAEFNDGRLSLSPLAASAAAAQSHNEASLDEGSKGAAMATEGQEGFAEAGIADAAIQLLESSIASAVVESKEEITLDDDDDTTFALETSTPEAEEDRPGLEDDI